MNTDTGINILAIETASMVFSAALATASGLWYFEADAGTRHSQYLTEIIDILLKKAGLKPAELSCVVCMNGPGSFTGLRIGFSCAKGMALSLGIPFYSVPSLDCMAYSYSIWPGLVLPVIDAKKNSWFCAIYSGGTRLTQDMDADIETIFNVIRETLSGIKGDMTQRQVLITGPDAGIFYETINKGDNTANDITFSLAPDFRTGNARELLVIAKNQKIINNESVDFNCGPEYGRKSDAEINFRK